MTASILGDLKLGAIAAVLDTVADVPGQLAECGVYRGGILRVLAERFPDRRVIGFDTFAGLPLSAWTQGEIHNAGEFGDTSLSAALATVQGLRNVQLVPGIFPESAGELDDELRFAFVHLDFDYYASTKAAIEWFLPRLSPGGLIVFDDYRWPHCPGVEQAIVEAGLQVEQTVEFQAIWRAQCPG